MKVLFITPTYAPAWTFGGVVTSLHRLLREMVAQGEDVTVYTTDAGLPPDDEGARRGFRLMNGVKVLYFKRDWTKPIFSRALSRKTEETIGEFDLMHLAALWQPLSISVRRAAVKARCPYVIAPHGSLDPWARSHGGLKKGLYYLCAERRIIRSAAGVFFTSKMEFNASSRFARPCQEVCSIPNGISFGQWARDDNGARQWRANQGIPADAFLYLSVGRLHYKKGLELLVQALAPMRGQNWRLAFVGNDDDGSKARLIRQFRHVGLSDQVSFHPTIPEPDLPAIYSAGNLFVLPSRHENFGNVVLEALSCGCPVLISDQVGISSELSGLPGVVVRTRDVTAWSTSLSSALTGNSAFTINTGDRRELERRFSVHSMAHSMMAFHRRVVARSAS